MPTPPPGLYEQLRTQALLDQLDAAGVDELAKWSRKLPDEDLAPALAAHLARLFADLAGTLRESRKEEWDEAVRDLAESLTETGHPFAELTEHLPTLPFRQLLQIQRATEAAVGTKPPPRPDLPLAVSALLTGSARTPSLASQLEKELASADHADWLVSFIKWSGIRPLRDALRRFTDRASSKGAPRLRIATTSYLGATDFKAIDYLARLPNTELRVSYDTHRTRLHAKAFLFRRATGFGSAYVGSANVSRVALDEGLEWTAKISEHELPHLWRQIRASFETHWEDDAEFQPLPAAELERFKVALEQERRSGPGGRGGADPEGPEAAAIPLFHLEPYGFQKEILEAVAAERRAGTHRHLVIAATGTGKTMISAFDYQAFARTRAEEDPSQEGVRPSLLFLAHREEILKQALASFRQVLRDRSFGDLRVGGAIPTQDQHLFASVQSWHSQSLDELAPDHFDYVVLDEAHHAAADSYQAILDHLEPRVLLGLTATPERTDGQDIRQDFGERFTHELRLPDAIERRLLAPFHYFGVADHESVDLSGLQWGRGGYQTNQLNQVFSGNDARARWVRDQVIEYATEPARVRGLGFCVSQDHARFMAARFTEWGLRSVALTAETPRDERRRVQVQLRQRQIRFIFTVDLYNEGVDIPEVDTVLLLRPTESLTVYLQQIGRGLRLHEDKPHLTVLDFVAPQHRRFRFADRFRALLPEGVGRIDRQIEEGFPWLPSGCLIDLEEQAAETILENIRGARPQRPRVIDELESLRMDAPDERPGLVAMLDRLHFDRSEPDALLKHGLPSQLRADAGWAEEGLPELEPYESGLDRGVRSLELMDDRALLRTLHGALARGASLPDDAGERVRLALAHSLIWGKERPQEGRLDQVHRFATETPALQRDLLDIVDHRLERLRPGSGHRFPERTGVLELHARYTREQILLALGMGDFDSPRSHREGVAHIEDRNVDAFFVTIRKSERRFSPTTMYEDYALTDRLFHWQSQSTTSPESPTGQRYIDHRRLGYTPMLFVRETSKLPNGLTAPFTFLGPLQYVDHEGSRPMSIRWRLEEAMPARVVRWSREVA